MTLRPDTYRLHNGEKATAQFSTTEYETRLAGLRAIMATAGVKAVDFYLDAFDCLLFGLSLLRLWPTLWVGCDRH